MKDGVGASSIWLPVGPWKTVLEFLMQRFAGVPAATWTARMAKGEVVDAAGSRLSPNSSYRSGVRLYYYRELEVEPNIPFEETVLHRDEHILVADKPHFLPVVPAGRFLQETLLVRLKRKLGLDFLAPLHRIDRETAGIVLFSTEPATRGAYHSLFEKRRVRKVYEALAPHLPGLSFPLTRRSRLAVGQPFFLVAEVDGEPNAETRIERLELRGDAALYRLTPITGRKHQLRVHMASLGMPIVNDPFYPQLLRREGEDYSKPLQLLARAIEFNDPFTGTRRQFESPQMLSRE